jgi:hypothetical protein
MQIFETGPSEDEVGFPVFWSQRLIYFALEKDFQVKKQDWDVCAA